MRPLDAMSSRGTPGVRMDHLHAQLSGLANAGSLPFHARHSSHRGSSDATTEQVVLTSGIVSFLFVGSLELANLLLSAITHINGWVAALNLTSLPGR